jgi:putative transposase
LMPGPEATKIELTSKQEALLKQLCRRQTSPQHQVRRARIILKAASGKTNQQIAEELGLARITVRDWRERWAEAAAFLEEAEAQQADDKQLLMLIERVLADAYRPGTPTKFSPEQVVQIVALACEEPALSERPISHWTAKELAAEAVKRGIVKSISPQSVERFLKGSGAKAAPDTLLAQPSKGARP